MQDRGAPHGGGTEEWGDEERRRGGGAGVQEGRTAREEGPLHRGTQRARDGPAGPAGDMAGAGAPGSAAAAGGRRAPAQGRSQPCRFFAAGFCRNGGLCPFEHGQAPARGVLPLPPGQLVAARREALALGGAVQDADEWWLGRGPGRGVVAGALGDSGLIQAVLARAADEAAKHGTAFRFLVPAWTKPPWAGLLRGWTATHRALGEVATGEPATRYPWHVVARTGRERPAAPDAGGVARKAQVAAPLAGLPPLPGPGGADAGLSASGLPDDPASWAAQLGPRAHEVSPSWAGHRARGEARSRGESLTLIMLCGGVGAWAYGAVMAGWYIQAVYIVDADADGDATHEQAEQMLGRLSRRFPDRLPATAIRHARRLGDNAFELPEAELAAVAQEALGPVVLTKVKTFFIKGRYMLQYDTV